MLNSGTSDKMTLYSSFLFSKFLISGPVPENLLALKIYLMATGFTMAQPDGSLPWRSPTRLSFSSAHVVTVGEWIQIPNTILAPESSYHSSKPTLDSLNDL